MSPAGLDESPSSLGSLCQVLHVPWRPPGGTPALPRSPWHRRPSFSHFLCPSLLLCGSGLSLPEEVLWGCLGPCLAPLHFPKVWGCSLQGEKLLKGFSAVLGSGCERLWGSYRAFPCLSPFSGVELCRLVPHQLPGAPSLLPPAPPCLCVCCTAEVTMSGSSFVRVVSGRCGSCASRPPTPQGAPQIPQAQVQLS